MEKWRFLLITLEYQSKPPLLPQKNHRYKYVYSLERTASQWITTFHKWWILHIVATVFLLTMLLCCVMAEALNTGPALFCVEFAGAPSMCSSFSSHSLKTSVHGCWRPRIPYWSKCFSDHSADPSKASASNTPQSEMSRQIGTVYGNLECCDSQSFTENWRFCSWCALENTIKRLCNSDVQNDGVLIQRVCDQPPLVSD